MVIIGYSVWNIHMYVTQGFNLSPISKWYYTYVRTFRNYNLNTAQRIFFSLRFRSLSLKTRDFLSVYSLRGMSFSGVEVLAWERSFSGSSRYLAVSWQNPFSMESYSHSILTICSFHFLAKSYFTPANVKHISLFGTYRVTNTEITHLQCPRNTSGQSNTNCTGPISPNDIGRSACPVSLLGRRPCFCDQSDLKT